MQYTTFGNSGITISRLAFGTMRLPSKIVDGNEMIDEELAIPMIHRAFESGVNYIDSAWFYGWHAAENTTGKALKGWRDKVYLATKYPINDDLDYRPLLEKQLEKLDTDYIDFYHFHGLGANFLTSPKRDHYLAEAMKAKEEGLIRHISFSFHDKPEVMFQLVDLGIFESVLCQYNLLDRANEDAIAYAKSKGLGTAVMGPIGGGRLGGMDPEVATRLGIEVKSSAELALRFVLSNPNVDIAISGMTYMRDVEENLAVASNNAPLSAEEIAGINAAMVENKRLADLYCTGCNYCTPYCTQEVNIPHIFSAMNLYRVYGNKGHAAEQYNYLGTNPWVKGKKASACIDCGACEEHCPQKIEIRKQLKECVQVFE